MSEEEIQKLADGCPPDKGDCAEAITWLAQEVLRLRKEAKKALSSKVGKVNVQSK